MTRGGAGGRRGRCFPPRDPGRVRSASAPIPGRRLKGEIDAQEPKPARLTLSDRERDGGPLCSCADMTWTEGRAQKRMTSPHGRWGGPAPDASPIWAGPHPARPRGRDSTRLISNQFSTKLETEQNGNILRVWRDAARSQTPQERSGVTPTRQVTTKCLGSLPCGVQLAKPISGTATFLSLFFL